MSRDVSPGVIPNCVVEAHPNNNDLVGYVGYSDLSQSICRCFKIQKSVGRTIDDLKPHKKGDIEKKKEKYIV